MHCTVYCTPSNDGQTAEFAQNWCLPVTVRATRASNHGHGIEITDRIERRGYQLRPDSVGLSDRFTSSLCRRYCCWMLLLLAYSV